MLRFDQGNARFNFRSVAVIIHDEHVLLHRNINDSFWALPGGRVEFFENSDMTLNRELFEELGATSVVKRHIWYVENFFEYAGKKYHEISNYFFVELDKPEQFPMDEVFRGIESEVDLEFKWYPLSKLPEVVLKPDFLQTGLLDIPSETKYIKVNNAA
ncbi:TPA: NUDIX hydrolase [Vibrio parahaemolyticus]|uniref:NUDIX hydrolase n=2 Tax=Vibrio parahaemolyticus TaxID=670 RepID=UPI0003F4FEBE|nr:NUDIX hydrolase [Vibrio parahaemolyticus]EGQ8107466.1 NUDIX hydrolase [Vibrio parahaemolyticus]EGR3304379.1 NUDIX domain-containing protein [Vibrio parahaemolyticus]EGR3320758.1 NUDIX domain-containing protein [Vibrio parahaemolyticus]EGU9323432.1 NUDIX domain-containing protein [Vibrio parahaemolyticus]EMA2435577.1 NUDIX hydrolase [Vibrio parahaemolyticus]